MQRCRFRDNRFRLLSPFPNHGRVPANKMYFGIGAERCANRKSTNDFKMSLNRNLGDRRHSTAVISIRNVCAPRGKELGTI